MACSVVDKIYLKILILIQQNIQSHKTDELSHQILNITSLGNAKDKILSQFSSRWLARWDSDDVFVFNNNHVFIVPDSQQYINTSLTNLSKSMFSRGQIYIDISFFSLIQKI